MNELMMNYDNLVKGNVLKHITWCKSDSIAETIWPYGLHWSCRNMIGL